MRIQTGLCYIFAIAALLQPSPMTAQEDLHQEDRKALLKILSEVEHAINAQDVEAIIAQMRPDCTVIWWNAEISRGHDDIRAYYRRMVKDPGRIISKYTTQAKLGEHARFVGAGADVAREVLREIGAQEPALAELFLVDGQIERGRRHADCLGRLGLGWFSRERG